MEINLLHFFSRIYKRSKQVIDGHVLAFEANAGQQSKHIDSECRNWRLFLETLKLCSPDISSAITNIYPTLGSLLKKYSECANLDEGVAVLSEIEVKRGAGRTATSRKIGKSLALKIYNFLNEKDPNVQIE